MSDFIKSEAAIDFVLSAESRETDPKVLRAIARNAFSMDEAIEIWTNGPRNPQESHRIWRDATDNGRLDGCCLQWGDQTLEIVCK